MTLVTGPGTPIQGVTLYSFTRFFHGREMGFAELVRAVASRGLGPGIEMVGFQSIRDFPNVGDTFVHDWRSLIDETGLVPTALGANADAGLRRDRSMSGDELVAYMSRQLEVAALLGFPLVRVQISLTPDDMERLLPVAERLGLTLGLEIHAHHSANHPAIQALLERYERLGSPNLGFIPDWGATMRQIPRTLLDRWRQRGASDELVASVDSYWNNKHASGAVLDDALQEERFEDVARLANRLGSPDLAVEMAVNATALFGHADVDSWRSVIPWAVHMHGKFYEIDAAGNEPAVPIPDILGLFIDAGYSRTISTEWEGFHWNLEESAFDMIGKQQALLRSSAEAHESRMVTDATEARALLAASQP